MAGWKKAKFVFGYRTFDKILFQAHLANFAFVEENVEEDDVADDNMDGGYGSNGVYWL